MARSVFCFSSKAFASEKAIRSIVILAFTFVLHAAITLEAQDYHPRRLMVQFTEQCDLHQELSEVFHNKTLQSLVPSSFPEINQEDPAFRSGGNEFLASIFEFFQTYPVQSIRPLLAGTGKSALSPEFERTYLVYTPKGMNLKNLQHLLLQSDIINLVEPDYVGYGGGKLVSMSEFERAIMLPKSNPPVNDVNFGLQYGLLNTGQPIGGITGVPGADINIVPGWTLTTGSSDVVLGVLDSGMPIGHYEFEGRVAAGYNFVSGNDNYLDDHGHGSSVTSIAAATGNNSGLMAGADWQSTILPVKILDQNNLGYYSWWINGINYAVENGTHVINMSVGGSSNSSLLQNAVNHALANGVIVVACMMNENNDVTFYPAGYDGVIAVGATNNKDERAESFPWGGGSNYGNHIDFAAPGDRIASLSGSNFQSIGFWSGTSMSAPFVAATISLMLSIDQSLTLEEIYLILKETTREQLSGPKSSNQQWDQFTGWGRIDVTAALELTLAGTLPSSVDDYHGNRQDKYGAIFPNPASGHVNVIADKEIHTLEIFDTSGRVLMTLPCNYKSSRTLINISDLSSGIYLIRFKGKNITQTEKFTVKNH